MEYGCIAERLGHSFSREIHAALGEYPYELCEVRPEALDSFMKARDFRGINVTIPYKEAVIPYLFHIDEQAKKIGAVNTVVNRDGKLYGYNTDFYGMKALITRMGLSLTDKKVAVLGTGGTSRTAKAVAEDMGARQILWVSRREREGVVSYDTLCARHADTQILINTTPCGMYPHPEGQAVDLSVFPDLEGVVDAVYNPVRPQLILQAQGRGIPAEGGLYMLVAQAVRASEIFLDTVYPEGTVQRVFLPLLRKKENLVLVGMPGSGKSTVGRLLADRLDREFCDTDALIEQATGMPIPEIFAKHGEAYFRDLESAVIREAVAGRNGLVVATGGGAILREENCDALRRNGRLYFLDRPVEELIPTADRPLASTAEDIRRRYRERYPRYCATADLRISVKGDAAQVAEEIRKDFESV
ncbi:MAG: shikimate dehydrogenase [Clostridia bacterium]|nr:shikimate dehydrogenase [Clostridia bacterium]